MVQPLRTRISGPVELEYMLKVKMLVFWNYQYYWCGNPEKNRLGVPIRMRGSPLVISGKYISRNLLRTYKTPDTNRWFFKGAPERGGATGAITLFLFPKMIQDVLQHTGSTPVDLTTILRGNSTSYHLSRPVFMKSLNVTRWSTWFMNERESRGGILTRYGLNCYPLLLTVPWIQNRLIMITYTWTVICIYKTKRKDMGR